MGILPSKFYLSILARDSAEFRWTLTKSILLIGGVTITIAAMKFLEGWVSLSWRNSLCTHLHERYLNQTMYYKLNVLDRTVDNPCVWGKEREKKIDAIAYLFCCRDQRITTDVDRFTQTFRSMITNLVSSPLMILYYTYMTYRFLGILGPLSVRSWFFFLSFSFQS